MTNELNEKPVPVKPEPEENKKDINKKEDDLDEALDESFPASDPVAVSITPQKVAKIPESDKKK
ncbi:hypothetical protein ACO0LL_04075 [Undibacterium sp. TC4M20W]|uniref:hypothetical protein n=1 Tax=unclassified Undibacterium TaxID=2630295 RepID=UPI003BF44C78